jgi:DNA repair protein RecN (Recombination protein N)
MQKYWPQTLKKYFFEQHDLDFEKQTLIRREVAAEGKSRAFINDTPVSLQILKELTSSLLQIHSQYNTLELKSKQFQLYLLDLLLGLDTKQKDFAKSYQRMLDVKKDLLTREQALLDAQALQDYNTFLLHELEDLQLNSPKVKGLQSELDRFAYAAHISEARQALQSILDDEGPYSALHQRKSILDKVKDLDSTLNDYSQRLDQILIEIKELARDAAFGSGPELDPSELPALERLQDQLNAAFLKHRVNTIEELILIEEQLKSQTVQISEQIETIARLKKTYEQLNTSLWTAAKQLHKQRLEGANELASALQIILTELKLPHTTLTFQLKENTELNSSGCTALSLLFSANLGHQPIEVEKAASGGELSRLMLALQKMISQKKALPTIIFDEIDTGVSGDVALKIGKLLHEMAQKGQCMAISHLPQVAAKAKHHFLVEKYVVDERMQTKVTSLSQANRITELARLLSGESITPAAIENAKSLLAIK